MGEVQEADKATPVNTVADIVAHLAAVIATLPLADRISALNHARYALHQVSPFVREPVDCVLWVPADDVAANDYNPNHVAPPEQALLEISIVQDGYTQPVVTWRTPAGLEVIDGFHRRLVGTDSAEVRERCHNCLPVTVANATRTDRCDRIAATIRHNRARGKHQVDAMSEIVMELTRRNWSTQRIGTELGMEPDEVLRLKQITGLAELFADGEFSEAWEDV